LIVRSPENVPDGAWGNYAGTTIEGFNKIKIWRSTTQQEIIASPRFIIHETGHAFENEVLTKLKDSVRGPITDSLWLRSYDDENFGGFSGGRGIWQFSPGVGGYDDKKTDDTSDDTDGRGEIFADMFIGWTFNKWEMSGNYPTKLSAKGQERADFMDVNMRKWVFDIINQSGYSYKWPWGLR